MMHVGGWRHRWRQGAWWVVAFCLLAGVLLPLGFMVQGALAPVHGGAWPSFSAFEALFSGPAGIALATANSLAVALLACVGQTLTGAMAGYALARWRFWGQAWVWRALYFTLLVPAPLNVVSLFLLMRQLHWLNTPWALVVPALFGAYGVLVFKQWFEGMPNALEEAATLEGCSPSQLFWQVALPLAGPPALSVGLLSFLGVWNSLFWPMVAVQEEALRTLPVALAALKASFRDGPNWPQLLAGALWSALPVWALYAVGWRYLWPSQNQGAVKE